LTYTQQKDANSEAKCKILKASVAALVQMTIEVGLSFIVEELNLAKLAGEGALKLARAEWPKFIAKQLVTLARTQTSELLSQQYNRMGLCDQFGGDFDAKNEQHIQELHVAFTVVVLNYRGILASNSARANNGFFAPEVGSPSELSELMFNSAWETKLGLLKP